jgi:ubiquinone/menaquinone biosynthesis C-methylase UbiE
MDQVDWDDINTKVNNELYGKKLGPFLKVVHKDLARFGNNRGSYEDVLEIGAGRGEHFHYVRKDFKSYKMTDISNWGLAEIQSLIKNDPRITFESQDIQDLSYTDDSIDRIQITCLLAHVPDPIRAMLEVRRVLRVGGVASFLISADPSFTLRLIRHFTTANNNIGELPYLTMNAISHRNHAGSLIRMAKWVFRQDEINIDYYPLRLPSWNLSTHIVVNVVKY